MDERGAWASRGRRILFQARPDEPWQRLAGFAPGACDLLRRSRPAARALRLERCNVYPTGSGRLLAVRDGWLHRIEGSETVAFQRIQGACLMNRAIAETSEGILFFGEYLTNPARRPIRIWRVAPDLSGADVVHTIESPRIRHVHAIQLDPYVHGRLWITMGDFEGECYLGYSDDEFRNLVRVGDGGQSYRTVGLLFHADSLSWLTDSELAPNRVVRMDRASGELSFHGELAGPVWYCAPTRDGAYLATTVVEPGPSIRTRHAFLLHSRDGLAWREVASFEKDAWPMPWFKFGSLSLPSGRFSSQAFWLSGEGLRGFDGGSWLCALDDAASRP
jgi:hypothetical protein